MIEKRLVALLLGNPAVTAMVGDRIVPVVVREDGNLPALTYRRLPNSQRQYTLAGAGGWVSIDVQITAWAREYDEARALIEEVRKQLDAYTEDIPDGIEVASVTEGGDDYVETLDLLVCSAIVTIQFVEE